LLFLYGSGCLRCLRSFPTRRSSDLLFVANLIGVELTLVEQLVVFMTAMIASSGAPGIPSAGMVTMVMVLQAVGLPAEAIAILLPIDRLLDTVRTAVNVEADIVGSLIVQKLADEGAEYQGACPRGVFAGRSASALRPPLQQITPANCRHPHRQGKHRQPGVFIQQQYHQNE